MTLERMSQIAAQVDLSCGQENGPGSEWLSEFASRLATEHEQKLKSVRDAVVAAFGKSPAGCDNMLLVRIDQYNELARAVNALVET